LITRSPSCLSKLSGILGVAACLPDAISGDPQSMKLFKRRYAIIGWLALFLARRYLRRRLRARTA